MVQPILTCHTSKDEFLTKISIFIWLKKKMAVFVENRLCLLGNINPEVMMHNLTYAYDMSMADQRGFVLFGTQEFKKPRSTPLKFFLSHFLPGSCITNTQVFLFPSSSWLLENPKIKKIKCAPLCGISNFF